MKLPMYLIIKTGYEGIESLCHLTNNPDEAINKIPELVDKKIKDNLELWDVEDMDEEFMKRLTDKQKIRDFYCIQKWDGHSFSCACSELGVSPSKLMLR